MVHVVQSLYTADMFISIKDALQMSKFNMHSCSLIPSHLRCKSWATIFSNKKLELGLDISLLLHPHLLYNKLTFWQRCVTAAAFQFKA